MYMKRSPGQGFSPKMQILRLSFNFLEIATTDILELQNYSVF